jgi:hypothetical protein
MTYGVPAFTPPDDMPGAGGITVVYQETTRITAKLTFEEAREVFGLGGTPDDAVGAHVGALVHYRSSLLALLGPHATEELPVSWLLMNWLLMKIDDPYGEL